MNQMKVKTGAILLLSSMLFVACSNSTNATASTQSKADLESTTTQTTQAKADHSEPGQTQYEAVIKMKDYDQPIVFTMDEGIAPETVENFVKLAQSGFYDGLTMHRIMEGFMIQGGDPTGTGTGGSSHLITGEFAANGFDNSLKHVRGTVSMARSNDPDSASSQFFIMQADNESLDGNYAAFGTVTSGMEVVDQIAQKAEPTDNNGTIEADQQPVIESITVTQK
ncbi:peptidylprolyl isomerase [Allobaculum stercoricanis]|uniref:peptidylprolyl isomerase n=1 Tax=Allobaculum stercoricanis TaxID=174709 RepID=UPI002943BD85|nr:peptidylprolyl isomerase [Allobaculum stercoricanis]